MAAKSLSSLTVDIKANTSQFQTGVKKAKSDIKSFSSAAEDAGKKVSGFASSMRGLAIGATAMAGGLLFATKSSLDYADAIGKAATNTGLSTDRVQELRFALDKYGLTQGAVDKTLLVFSKNMGDFSRNSGAAKAALDQMQISFKDSGGQIKSNSVLFDEVIDKLGGIKDQSVRTSLAMQLFGEEGGKVFAAVSTGGAAGLKSYADQVHALGAVLKESLIREAETANDKLSALMEVLRVKGVEAALAFTPHLIDLADAFTKNAGSIAETITELATFIHDIGSATAAVGEFLDTAGQALGLKESSLGEQLEQNLREMQRLKALYDKAFFDAPKESLKNSIDALQMRIDEQRTELDTISAVKAVNFQRKNGRIDTPQALKETILKMPAINAGSVSGKTKTAAEEQADAFKSLRESMNTSEQQIRKNLDAQELWVSGADSAFIATKEWQEGMTKLQDEFKTLTAVKPEYELFFEEIDTKGVEAFNNLSKAVQGWGDTLADQLASGEFNFKTFASSVLKDIARMQIKSSVTDPLVGLINGGLSSFARSGQESAAGFVGPPSSLSSSGGGFLSSLFGGFFADGGRPPMGKVSVVGERGPELFIPNTAGTIVPGGAGGGVNIITTVNVDGGSAEQGNDVSSKVVSVIKSVVTSELRNQMRAGNMLSSRRG